MTTELDMKALAAKCGIELQEPGIADPGVANWQSRMTDHEFLEHARGYTAARGFSVIERLMKIIDGLKK
jgi:hypothetical protein